MSDNIIKAMIAGDNEHDIAKRLGVPVAFVCNTWSQYKGNDKALRLHNIWQRERGYMFKKESL